MVLSPAGPLPHALREPEHPHTLGPGERPETLHLAQIHIRVLVEPVVETVEIQNRRHFSGRGESHLLPTLQKVRTDQDPRGALEDRVAGVVNSCLMAVSKPCLI